MGLQFLERLEKSGKVNAVEKKILRHFGRCSWKSKRRRHLKFNEKGIEENEGSRK